MKVIISNATGSDPREALLDKDSGVIEFESGEISHVLFEKQFNRSIFVIKEKKKDETILLEEAKTEEVKPVSIEQKPASKKAKKK